MTDQANKQRKNMQLFMKRKNLTAYAWAKQAGITEGTIRSFLCARSHSLNYSTLMKLADVVGVAPKEIIDPDANYVELLDNSLYLERELLEACMERIDSVLANKNVKISDKDRRKLYLAWYDLKDEESRNKKDNPKFDTEKITAMLKLIS